jgi:hypothetical protein
MPPGGADVRSAMRPGKTTFLAWDYVDGCTVSILGGVTKTGQNRRFTSAADRLSMAAGLARGVPHHEEQLGLSWIGWPTAQRPGSSDHHQQAGREGETRCIVETQLSPLCPHLRPSSRTEHVGGGRDQRAPQPCCPGALTRSGSACRPREGRGNPEPACGWGLNF